MTKSVDIARTWVGTPYHHQASKRRIGTDCLGLIIGVWAEYYGKVPQKAPAYSRDWNISDGVYDGMNEPMLVAFRQYFDEIDFSTASVGDVLVFRYGEKLPAKHAGILTTVPNDRFAVDGIYKMIHSIETRGVEEVIMVPWWLRRVAGTFRFR
jgi:NlpC/P60 family putative phage cell wall peptidase